MPFSLPSISTSQHAFKSAAPLSIPEGEQTLLQTKQATPESRPVNLACPVDDILCQSTVEQSHQGTCTRVTGHQSRTTFNVCTKAPRLYPVPDKCRGTQKSSGEMDFDNTSVLSRGSTHKCLRMGDLLFSCCTRGARRTQKRLLYWIMIIVVDSTMFSRHDTGGAVQRITGLVRGMISSHNFKGSDEKGVP